MGQGNVRDFDWLKIFKEDFSEFQGGNKCA